MKLSRNRRRLTIDGRCCIWTDTFASAPPWRRGEQVIISAIGADEWLQPIIERLMECSPGVRFVILCDSMVDPGFPVRPLHPDYGSDMAHELFADSLLFVAENEEHPHHRNALFYLCHRLHFRRAYLCQQHHILFDITRHTRTPRIRGRSFSTFSWVEPETWRYLYRTARDGHGTGVALEIGSHIGGTTLALAQGSRDGDRGCAVALDHALTDAYWANLASADPTESVLTIEQSSHQAALDWPDWAREHDLEPAIRLLLLDGDHSYESVRQDLELWSRHLEPGGLLVAHDYYNPFQPGVARAMSEHLKRHAQWRIVHRLKDAIVCLNG